MSRFARKAQRHLEEPVLAAAGVQARGAVAATLGGGGGAAAFGILGAAAAVVGGRVHLRHQQRATGLALTRYMVLAVTEERIHLFQAGSTWSIKRPLGTWDREATNVTVEWGALTHRLVLEVSGEPRTVALEVARGRPGAELIRELASRSGS